MKQKLNKRDLVTQLYIQLEKISDFVSSYDSGKYSYAQDIAVKLRVIFHHTGNSKSLLTQLKLEHIDFVNTAAKYVSTNLLSHWGLIAAESKFGSGFDGSWRFVAPLGNAKRQVAAYDNWWNLKKVIVDSRKNIFTRKKLVLELADTDGGAHVDDGLRNEYHDLSRKNSLDWFQVDKWGNREAMNNPVPPSIRQIAYEALETFKGLDFVKESRLK